MDSTFPETPLVPALQGRGEPCLDLELPAVLGSLRTIRIVALGFLRSQLGDHFPQVMMEELLLALQEACTNVVRHSYVDAGQAGPIHVQIVARPDLVRFLVADEGPGFDAFAAGNPDLEHPRDGGYGLHLLRQIMSRVEYRNGTPRNVLILERSLTCPWPGEPA